MDLDLSGLCLDMSPALIPVLLYSNFLVLLLWRLCGTSLAHIGCCCKYHMEVGRLFFVNRFESSKTRGGPTCLCVPKPSLCHVIRFLPTTCPGHTPRTQSGHLNQVIAGLWGQYWRRWCWSVSRVLMSSLFLVALIVCFCSEISPRHSAVEFHEACLSGLSLAFFESTCFCLFVSLL